MNRILNAYKEIFIRNIDIFKGFFDCFFLAAKLMCLTLPIPLSMWVVLTFFAIVEGKFVNTFYVFRWFYYDGVVLYYPNYRWHIGLFFLCFLVAADKKVREIKTDGL